ncbi:MAG: carbohydrate ABC transporter permease [Chloroflexota bacterium]|nr:carbohydrate ABC transporter permease [Chloroflexota bacterium]
MSGMPPADNRVLFERLRRYMGKSFKHAFLVMVAIFSLSPILWLIGIAFRPVEETYVTPMQLLPRTLTLENTRLVFEELPQLMTLYRNSIVITGVAVILVLIISSLAGYAFARMSFPGREIFFWAVVASMFMPRSMAIPGLYEILQHFQLVDTLPGLYLPYTAWFLSLSVFIMRSAFAAIPQDLEDAAMIDGCSRIRLYWQVMIPLSTPAVVTVAIFTFVPVWGEYLWAFTFTSTVKAMPMSVGIKLLQAGPEMGEWTFPVAAMAVLISFIPPLLIYIGLQRWFTKGLMEGALKF